MKENDNKITNSNEAKIYNNRQFILKLSLY